MGKTALLEYAADRADGMRVLRVTGVEAESDLAFAGLHGLVWPIIDERRNLAEPQRAALEAALGLARGDGARSLSGVGRRPFAARGRRRVAGRSCAWSTTRNGSTSHPSDSLVFAARRLVAEGIVIIFGAREGELRRFDAPSLDELTLAGLDRESAAALLGRSGREAVASVRERLLVAAAGNPLALLELPAGLSDAQLAGRETLPEALPLNAALRAVFAQRIGRLAGIHAGRVAGRGLRGRRRAQGDPPCGCAAGAGPGRV